MRRWRRLYGRRYMARDGVLSFRRHWFAGWVPVRLRTRDTGPGRVRIGRGLLDVFTVKL